MIYVALLFCFVETWGKKDGGQKKFSGHVLCRDVTLFLVPWGRIRIPPAAAMGQRGTKKNTWGVSPGACCFMGLGLGIVSRQNRTWGSRGRASWVACAGAFPFSPIVFFPFTGMSD